MTKKTLSKTRSSSMPPRTSNDSGMLGDIHKKIASSAALNGGFDTLLYKIDKIEQSQGQLVTNIGKIEENQCHLSDKVDKIHEAIYDPNDGLFSKISEAKLENTQKFSDVESKLSEISTWKKYKEKSEDKIDIQHDEANIKLNTLERSVESLVKSKTATWSILKWLGVALGGGILTLCFKWLETLITMKH